MASIRWTSRAADDLVAIVEYIEEDSPAYARLFAQKLVTAIKKLEVYPPLGRIVPEYQDPNLRETLLGSYRIVYALQPDVVEIITVRHGARLFSIDRQVEGS
jgi:plasmid stabilization system protein ParE